MVFEKCVRFLPASFFSAMLSKNSSDSQRFLDLVFSASPIGWEEGFVSRDVVAQLLCRILLR